MTTTTIIQDQNNPSTSPYSPIHIQLTDLEIETILSNLQPIQNPSDVSSDAFLKSYAVDLERCSLQAHADAAQQCDERVVEAIVLYDKVSVLVETLVVVEVWREYVLPELLKQDYFLGRKDTGSTSTSTTNADSCNSNVVLRIAFTLHVEATIVGLLNLVLYKYKCSQESVGVSCDHVIALVDYCARRMTSLAVPMEGNDMLQRQQTALEEKLAAAVVKKSFEPSSYLEDIRNCCLDTEFKVAVAATSLARYLCEHVEELPVSVQSRILDTHDYLMLIISLINEPPWTQYYQTTVSSNDASSEEQIEKQVRIWQKYIDNEWKKVPNSELLNITKCEAQCWFIVYFLSCSNACRKSYGLNTYRKDQLLRLRRYLNDVTTDQLPVLIEVMRYLDELALMNVPESATGHGSILMMQEVEVLRETVLKANKGDWKMTSLHQIEQIFSKVPKLSSDSILREISNIYSCDGIEDIVEQSATATFVSKQKKVLHSVDVTIEAADSKKTQTINLILLPFANDSGTSIQTPQGPFLRLKLRNGTKDGKDKNEIPAGKDIKISASVIYEGNQYDVEKCTTSISLPLAVIQVIDGTDDNDNVLSKKQWRQVGTLETGFVLQLSFVSNDTARNLFSFQQAFLSRPDTYSVSP